MAENSRNNDDQMQRENAIIGYQVATSLWIHEGDTYWSKFNAMLVANSIILGALAIIISQIQLFLLLLVLTAAGIAICVFWLIVTVRTYAYYNYWIFSARELEEKFLPNVTTISRGGRFAEGKEVDFDWPKTNVRKKHRTSYLGRLTIGKVVYSVIFLFITVYTAILILRLLSVI